jgi:CheY-like chemotaxis protein
LVEIEWKGDEDAWCAFADQAQLELALVNLIINARDAMPDGGTVTVSVENRAISGEGGGDLTPGDYVVIVVTDTGTGISPEDLEKVMEPFFTTKAVGKGSGLGLSMVYGFAQQSEGAFRLSSALGKGTRAELWLPRAPEASRPTRVAADEGDSQKVAKPIHILLVDDHEEVRTTTAAMLEDLGHTVVAAANGSEALKALRDGHRDYGLMISDYAMPHLSGSEFLKEARALCPDVPALIITGYAEADGVRDRPEGVEILLKPFTRKALEKALARVCQPT